MSRNKHLRSVCEQCRNLSSSRISKVEMGARFLVQGTGVTLGWISGYYLYGGQLEKYEEKRQQIVMDVFGNPAEIEDLRKKMWPELRKMAWFRSLDKKWSDYKSKS
ncbi:hypothetical protein ISN44_As08g007190 [Arabidopsis suecica]|uniref:Uncharacterized protein n=1 Tax=Arabidopsis suecica TaxID=45249 RepID=A0A8T2B6Z4_ARASU|nr:hypothetical protein ISN44_As08g007190 [Arabidopsis suecica]